MLADFELAEVIWDVAEPGLSLEDRDTLCAAFHTCEPILAMCAALRAVARTRIRLPANVFEEFRSWLAAVPPLRPTDRWLSAWLEVHVLASQVRRSSDRLTPIGGYSEYTLCRFVLAEAGVSGDATPRGAGRVNAPLARAQPSRPRPTGGHADHGVRPPPRRTTDPYPRRGCAGPSAATVPAPGVTRGPSQVYAGGHSPEVWRLRSTRRRVAPSRSADRAGPGRSLRAGRAERPSRGRRAGGCNPIRSC